MRRLLTLWLLWAALLTASLAQGTNVTSHFLTNPDFSGGNADGWSITVSRYQNGGYQGASYYNGSVSVSNFIEVWLPSSYGSLGDGRIFQTTTLPAGSYRLEADIIASRQNNAITPEGVSLMAADNASGMTIAQTAVGTDDGKPQHFSLDFTLTEQTPVDLGLELRNATPNWVAADNFKLTMTSGMKLVTSIRVSGDKTGLIPGSKRQMTATILPADATIQTLAWTSSNEKVLKVDQTGLIKVVGVGSATVRASAQDGSNKFGTLLITTEAGSSTADALVINEVMSCNIDQFVDPSWNYGGWIELYNPTDNDISLYGHYITDDPDNPKKHQLREAELVPPHGHYTIWFDHFSEDVYPTQVDFKLDTEGGWIALVSPDGRLLANANYPAGVARTSYARSYDGSSTWGMTAKPTPGATNAGTLFATERLKQPTVDVEGHIFDSYPVTVRASWPAGSTLRYTWDGSAPTATNGQTSADGVFTISGGLQNTLRLAAVQDGKLPSAITTNTYLHREHNFSIPVMVITGTDNDFFSDQMGCLVQGTNGVAGGNNWVWNVYQDWDRPATFEYFAPTGERIFRQDVDLSPAGGWSRTFGWHTSFKLKANKVYEGLNSMDYPFFADKPNHKHKTLQIRNGGNDSGCRFRDAATQQVIGSSGIYVEYQEYQPVFHYINGRFGCVFNMREPNNKHYAYSNYGLDTDFMDQFELTAHPVGGNYYEQMEGTKDTLNLLLNLSAQCADPVIYNQICDKLLDIDEYANYMALGIYVGCGDWITNSNNVKGFRSTAGDGRFRFVFLDMDDPFGNQSMASSIYNNQNNEVARLWRNMLNNADFRKKFLDAYSLVCGSVFETERCKLVLNELYNNVEPMMKLSGESATSSYNTLMDRMGNTTWNKSVSYNNTIGFSRLSAETTQPVNISVESGNSAAQLLYNGMDIPTGKFAGRAFLPLTITAGDVAGYDFAGWKQLGDIITNSSVVFTTTDLCAYYDKGSLDGTGWMLPSYNASAWGQGYAPLGYDTKNGDLAQTLKTVLGYGGNANDKYPTYYFRHTFDLASLPAANEVYTLEYTMDDGCIIYVNGTEVKRDNMPSGTVSFWSYSTTYDQRTATVVIPANTLRKGTNVIAVEVHNNNSTSTDILWSATLHKQQRDDSGGAFVTTSNNLTLTADHEGASFIAIYTPKADASTPAVVINEISASNEIYVNTDYFKKDDWIELYNTTDEPVDVAGMYLSNDEFAPQQFQIPSNGIQNTIIAPHGHLKVWASKRANNGSEIHTNFKLGNSDGQLVTLTSEDGSWGARLAYNAHGDRQTVGLYPDGGSGVYRFSRPTLGGKNQRTSYDTYLFDNEQPEPAAGGFALSLTEGWNWVSHPLYRDIACSEINANALRIQSQTEQTALESGLGWRGSLTALTAGKGYKVQMAADAFYAYNEQIATDVRAVSVSLRKGWNWIGYPYAGTQSLAEALSGFTPSEGDIIVSRQGFSTYENGAWAGSLTTLKGGQGYLYKSAKTAAMLFASSVQSAECRVQSSTAQPNSALCTLHSALKNNFRPQPRTPWTVIDGAYPNVMSIVARVVSDDVNIEDNTLSVGAFDENGECRGIGRYADGGLFLTVFGNGGEQLSLMAADPSTGMLYDIAEQLSFTPDILGSRRQPFALHIGDVTDITLAKCIDSTMCDGTAASVSYHNLDGTLAGHSPQSLSKGVYIKRITLTDGRTISKKIIISLTPLPLSIRRGE